MSDSALLVIDMQEKYLGEGSNYGYDRDLLVARVNERVEQAARAKDLIIYVKNKFSAAHPMFDEMEFVKGLLPASDFILEKDKVSAFSNQRLLDILHNQGVVSIDTIGIDGNCCVAYSAIDASFAGFLTRFPLKYIGMRDKRLFSGIRKRLFEARVQILEDTVRINEAEKDGRK